MLMVVDAEAHSLPLVYPPIKNANKLENLQANIANRYQERLHRSDG